MGPALVGIYSDGFSVAPRPYGDETQEGDDAALGGTERDRGFADSLLEEAVTSEPVSEAKFPKYRKFSSSGPAKPENSRK